MVVFDTEMHQNGFFFRNLHEKLGKKMLWNNFFWSYGGLLWCQKWTYIKIDHFTKNCPKSSILSILHRGKAQNDGN
jgi:hypothetical protein